MGHAHVNLALDLDGMPAVEPTSSGRAIVVVDVPVGGGRADMAVRPVRGDAVAGADPAVDSVVKAALARVETKVQEPVATIAAPLRRTGQQHALGNLLADAARVMGSADFAAWNNGGMRADIDAGPLRFGGVHEVTPFGNTLVRLRVRGKDLAPVFERGLFSGRADLHVSGVRIEFDPARPRGQRITRLTLGNGAPVDPDRIYTLVQNNFMVEDEYLESLRAAISTEYLPIRDSDMLAEYLRRQPQPVRGDDAPRVLAIPSRSN
jgi:5'-nucleotidase